MKRVGFSLLSHIIQLKAMEFQVNIGEFLKNGSVIEKIEDKRIHYVANVVSFTHGMRNII
jgi:hypothetical protein